MTKFEMIKVRDVKSPERNVKENAGIDFYIPNKSAFTEDEFKKFGPDIVIYNNSIHIPPHKDIKIPSGIKSKFNNNIALVAFNKSGIATKKKLIVGAEVIDSAYQGEWHFHLINTSDEIQIIEFGQKIVQFIPIVIDTSEISISDKNETEFFTESTSRGTGGFGSTGI